MRGSAAQDSEMDGAQSVRLAAVCLAHQRLATIATPNATIDTGHRMPVLDLDAPRGLEDEQHADGDAQQGSAGRRARPPG